MITTTDEQWRDQLADAYTYAQFSQDRSTQNGGFLLGDNDQVIGVGWNSFPEGVQDLEERHERPAKYEFTEHAERNCIYDAASQGFRTSGSTLVVAWAACADCARAIIQAGVIRVVTHLQAQEQCVPTDGTVDWQASIANALTMMEEAGVEVLFYDGKVGAEPLRHSGRIWEP